MVPNTLISYEKTMHVNDSYDVYAYNGHKMGNFLMKEDGYYDFWPDLGGGYWPGYMLRALADALDELNYEWDKQIREDLTLHATTTEDL